MKIRRSTFIRRTERALVYTFYFFVIRAAFTRVSRQRRKFLRVSSHYLPKCDRDKYKKVLNAIILYAIILIND